MDIIFDKTTADVLTELEKTQKEFWNIPRKTGILINTFIKMMNIQSALEIGTSNGYSGIWIGKALKHTGGRLKTIEYYDKNKIALVLGSDFILCTRYPLLHCKQHLSDDVYQNGCT